MIMLLPGKGFSMNDGCGGDLKTQENSEIGWLSFDSVGFSATDVVP